MNGLPAGVASECGRVFVPLAVSGCGVGCKYCYIGSPAGRARALPASRMAVLLRGLARSIDAGTITTDTLVAIGCDTEVAISSAMTANALMCLDFADTYRLPVQLATKFPLPEPLRHRLDSWSPHNPHPVVFTTITTIASSARIEPNAPRPAERVVNFGPHGGHWLSYALVKPFLAQSESDICELLALLDGNRPDGVVVGIRYRRAAGTAVPGSPHPIAEDWMSVPLPQEARAFMARLLSMGFRLFMNTRCVSAWHNSGPQGVLVRRDHPHLCVNCGACDDKSAMRVYAHNRDLGKLEEIA